MEQSRHWAAQKFKLESRERMKVVTAMMAGIVVELLVKEGDQVGDGQDVAILESMKMQLPIQSSESGKVTQIKVKAGDFINEGDTLLSLE